MVYSENQLPGYPGEGERTYWKLAAYVACMEELKKVKLGGERETLNQNIALSILHINLLCIIGNISNCLESFQTFKIQYKRNT